MKFKAPAPGNKKDSNGPSLYVRLKDGEAIKFTPRGEIYEFWTVFGVQGEASPMDPNAKLRYKMNVIVNEGGKLVVKILEFGKTVYEQLYQLSQVCDVTKTKFQLSRKGAGKSDTVYTLVPVINEPIPLQVLNAFEGMTLHILNKNKPTESSFPKNYAPGADDFGPQPPDSGPDVLPF